MRRLALVTALALVAQLAIAQPALAANNMVRISGTTLHISGQLYPMDASVRQVAGSFVVDNHLGILAGAGCAHGADVTVVVCTGTVTYVSYTGSPQRDRMDYWTPVPAELRGGGGDDELWGGDGPDLIVGDAGNDAIYGWTGEDQLFGEAGNDTLYGQDGADAIEGDAGDDYLSGGPDVDCSLYKDHVTAVTADLDGAAGDDGSSGEADTTLSDVECLMGGEGNDWLVGDSGPNLIEGGNGMDVLFGLGGSDKLAGDAAPGGGGSPSADWVYGGDGADWLLGNEGDDHLFGEGDFDNLEGEAGFDRCDTGAGGGTTSACEW